MIEVIYKDEKQDGQGNEKIFSVPRNIRQIGLIDRDLRIYVEDYVYTFLGRLSQVGRPAQDAGGCVAILTGSVKRAEGVTYVFIKGALSAEGMEAASDHMGFTDEIWKKLNEEEKKYFPEQETVGWFFSQPGIPLEMTEAIKRAHLKHFGGGEKIMMLMDPAEREDAFFCYENGFMVKQNGYYVYYEKNPLMQAYMLEKNHQIQPEKTEEVQDEAVQAFRKIINGKKRGQKNTREHPPVFSYGATACLVIAVLAVGGGFYRNYRQIQSVNRQASEVAAILEQSGEPEDTGASESMDEDSDVFGADTSEVSGFASSDAEASDPENWDSETQGSASSDPALSDSAPSGSKATGSAVPGTGSSGTASSDSGSSDPELSGSPASGVENSDSAASGFSSPDAAFGGASAADPSPSPAVKSDDEAQSTSGQEADLRKEKAEQTSAQPKVRTSYVIRPGDTLYQISLEKYGDVDTIKEICRLNGISQDEIIYPGQILKLP